MGNIPWKFSQPDSSNEEAGSHCQCFHRKSENEPPAIIMDSESGNVFELPTASIISGGDILAVPNEIRRQRSSYSLTEENRSEQQVAESFSIPAISASNKEDSVFVDKLEDISACQTAMLKSQLAKSKRENRRLIGELKALRTAYSQIANDKLHWQSQASLLLERAKLFENQLRASSHNNKELRKFRPSLSTSTSQINFANNPLQISIQSTAKFGPIIDQTENEHPIFNQTRSAFVFFIGPESEFCKLLKIYGLLYENAMEIAIFKVDESCWAETCSLISSSKLFHLYLVHNSADTWPILMHSQTAIFFENFDNMAEELKELLTHDDNASISPTIMTGLVGQSGREEQLCLRISESYLSIDMPSASYYLSQLHMAWKEQSKAQRSLHPFVILSKDRCLLLMLMSSWLRSLDRPKPRPLVLTHIVSSCLSIECAVADTIFHLTSDLQQLVDLKPLVCLPNTASISLLFGDFQRHVKTYVKMTNQDVIIMLLLLSNATFDAHKTCRMVIRLFKNNSTVRSRIYVFTDSNFESLQESDDEMGETASQISGVSQQSVLTNNTIVVPSLDKSESLNFARKLMNQFDIEQSKMEELLEKIKSWLENVAPEIDLTLLVFTVKQVVHMFLSHSEIISPVCISIDQYFAFAWIHILSTSCYFAMEDIETLKDLVAVLSFSVHGIQSEEAFRLIPRLNFMLWYQFTNVGLKLGLLTENNEVDENLFFLEESRLVHTVRLKFYVKQRDVLRQYPSLLGQPTVDAWEAKLKSDVLQSIRLGTLKGRSLVDFACTSRTNGKADDMNELTSIIANPAVLHVIYHSNNLFHFFDKHSSMLSSSAINNCRKICLNEEVALPSGIRIAHCLISLARLAMDRQLYSLSSSLLADAEESAIAEYDPNCFSSWLIASFCHLLSAYCAMRQDSVNGLTNRRSVATKHVAHISKMLSNTSQLIFANAKEQAVLQMATEFFEKHVTTLNLALKHAENSHTIM